MERNRRLEILPSEELLPKGEMKRPEGIREQRKAIGGFERTWEEYIPTGYDGKRALPLVISLHGGAKYTMAYKSSWAKVAERENFIVVFGHSLAEGKIRWNAWREFTKEDGFPDDVEYLDEVIACVKRSYRIDGTRIYLHGQSVGDKMASTYLFERSEQFAAAACLSGPMGASCFVNQEGNVFYGPVGKVPIIRRHGAEDVDIPLRFNRIDIKREPGSPITEKHRRDKMTAHQVINNWLWRQRNECEDLPWLAVRGKYNLAVYPGNPYDFWYYAENASGHSPGLDMADDIWSYFFTGYRRVNGQAVRTAPSRPLRPDEGCTAAASGSALAYVNHKKVPLDSSGNPAVMREGVLCVPAPFMETALGAEVRIEGGQVWIRCCGRELQAAKGNHGVVFDCHYREMGPCFEENGMLYLPLAGTARFFGYRPLEGYEAVYVTKEDGTLSYDLAYLIRQILGVEKEPTPKECLDTENRLAEEWIMSGGMEYDRSTLPKN